MNRALILILWILLPAGADAITLDDFVGDWVSECTRRGETYTQEHVSLGLLKGSAIAMHYSNDNCAGEPVSSDAISKFTYNVSSNARGEARFSLVLEDESESSAEMTLKNEVMTILVNGEVTDRYFRNRSGKSPL